MDIHYLQLSTKSTLPDISGLKPFLAVLVLEESVEQGWRNAVSQWLVKSGCKSMISWGKNRVAWDEAVDLANIAQFDKGDIPEDELVLANDGGEISVEQFLREAKIATAQDCANFEHTLIVHISGENKENEILALYSRA